jgi:hypothetical protein
MSEQAVERIDPAKWARAVLAAWKLERAMADAGLDGGYVLDVLGSTILSMETIGQVVDAILEQEKSRRESLRSRRTLREQPLTAAAS